MEPIQADIEAARAKLQERFGNAIRIGGDSGARLRKRGGVHKTTVVDDKKLQTAIKRMGLSQLPGVDEVAMIKSDGKALCFNHPKISGALNANTFVVSGAMEEKRIDEYFTLPPDMDPEVLKKIAAEWRKMQKLNTDGMDAEMYSPDNDLDDVPVLVDNFEAIADGIENPK